MLEPLPVTAPVRSSTVPPPPRDTLTASTINASAARLASPRNGTVTAPPTVETPNRHSGGSHSRSPAGPPAPCSGGEPPGHTSTPSAPESWRPRRPSTPTPPATPQPPPRQPRQRPAP